MFVWLFLLFCIYACVSEGNPKPFSLQTILVSFVLFLLPSYHEAADRGTLGGGDVAVVNAASLAEVVVGDAGENEGAKPHVLSAVFPFRFICRLVQISCRFYMVVYLLEQICPLYHYDEK